MPCLIASASCDGLVGVPKAHDRELVPAVAAGEALLGIGAGSKDLGDLLEDGVTDHVAVLLVEEAVFVQVKKDDADFLAALERLDRPLAELVRPRHAGERVVALAEFGDDVAVRRRCP